MAIILSANPAQSAHPSAQVPGLSARSSKEAFLEAIRVAGGQIGRKPIPSELRSRIGSVFDILSDKYFSTPFTAIQAAYAQRPSPAPVPSEPILAPGLDRIAKRLLPALFDPDSVPRPVVTTWGELKQVMGNPSLRYQYMKDLWRKKHGVLPMPQKLVLIGHKKGASDNSPVGAIALLSEEEANARKIPQPYFQVRIEDAMRRVGSAKGVGGLELGAATMFARTLDPVEMAFLARLWGTQYQPTKADDKVVWGKFLQFVSNNAIRLVRLLLQIQIEASHYPTTMTPNKSVLLVRREGRGDGAPATGIRLLTREEFESEREALQDPQIAKIFFWVCQAVNRHIIWDIQDTGALDVAVHWIAGQVGALDEYERNLVSTIFESRARIDSRPEGTEIITWGGINHRVSRGVDALFRRYWRIRRVLEPELPENPEHLILVVRRQDKGVVGGIRILQPSDLIDDPLDNQVVQLEGHLENGKYVATEYAGWNGKELYGNATGISFAPDADEIGRVNEEVRQLTSSPAGYAEAEPMSKPEPLFTPADVMTLPQLERPASAPKVEIAVPGFHVLRPDEIDATKLLPSDTIPVITHSHDDCVEDMSVVATAAAMVMGVIAFFYGGAALMRAPMGNPAFGSGGLFAAPQGSRYPEGA